MVTSAVVGRTEPRFTLQSPLVGNVLVAEDGFVVVVVAVPGGFVCVDPGVRVVVVVLDAAEPALHLQPELSKSMQANPAMQSAETCEPDVPQLLSG